METSQQLIQLKDRITQANTEKARHEGQLQTLQDRLKDEFNCLSMEDAQKLLENLEYEIQEKEQKLSDGVNELETKYDWE